MKEESLATIRNEPPPSEKLGYELYYKNTESYISGEINKKAKKEKMSLIDIITTPGLNLVFFSLIAGTAILAYMIYMILFS